MHNAFTPTTTTGEALPKEWLRVKEATAYCGISKPALYDLMNRGLIRNCSLKQRGQIKGTRLISFDSLRAFLEGNATGGATTTAKHQPTAN
jgi:predicted DNA-binding transcriptional regulator AlpA